MHYIFLQACDTRNSELPQTAAKKKAHKTGRSFTQNQRLASLENNQYPSSCRWHGFFSLMEECVTFMTVFVVFQFWARLDAAILDAL